MNIRHNDKRPVGFASRGTSVRQRGSALILVVVTLVLMVLMGAAYVQIARVDRLVTAQISDPNIDEVVTAIILQLKSVLKEDQWDDGDRLFNADVTSGV